LDGNREIPRLASCGAPLWPASGRGVAFLIEARRKAGLTKADVAKRLGLHQSFVAMVEGGQRRVDVIEFLDFADGSASIHRKP
jgi:hypothetical protein